MRTFCIAFLACAFLGTALLPCTAEAQVSAAKLKRDSHVMTRQELIENAKEALQKGGVNLYGVNIIYDDGNTYWQERLAFLEKDTSQNHGILPHGILRNKEYQVVFFDFVESSPVDDTWVFLDPKTGEVISVYEEK